MSHKTSLVLYFTTLLSFCVNTPRLFGTVEGGALLKGNVLSTDTNVIPEASASSLAIKWSSTDLDPGAFDFNASTPTVLKLKLQEIIFSLSPVQLVRTQKPRTNARKYTFSPKRTEVSLFKPRRHAPLTSDTTLVIRKVAGTCIY